MDGVDGRRRGHPVQRAPVDDVRLHTVDGEPDRTADRQRRFVDSGLASGTYYYKVTAEDEAGNVSPASNQASAAVTGGTGPLPGLVAAWGFDTGSGTTAADQSGNGNTGTLSSATWSTAGKYGSALSFNGGNAYVNVPDSNSLDLTTGMTIEGWVRPTSGGGWQTLLVKERPGELVYGFYANTDANRPQSQVTIGNVARLLNGTTTVPVGLWTHLAATFDGTTERLYANGTQVAQLAVSGAITTSASPLKIGGNAIWGEWFNGLIDEVRVYNRALTPTEITSDMNTAITNPDSTPPTAPGALTATGGLGQVSLGWAAATDNIGVVRYNVHRSTTSGFTPSTANRIAQPTATSYIDSGLASGTYYYKVVAEDASGNTGPASNEANAVASADTTPPSAPSGLTATGRRARRHSPGRQPLTPAGSPATTCTAPRPAASHRRPPTVLLSPPERPTPIPDSPPGTYFYKVTADDNAGNTGPASNEATSNDPRPRADRAWSVHGASMPGKRHDSRRPVRQRATTGRSREPTWSTTGQVRERALLQRHQCQRQRARFPTRSTSPPAMTIEELGQARGGRRMADRLIVKERPGDLVYGALRQHRPEQAAIPRVTAAGHGATCSTGPPPFPAERLDASGGHL